MEARELHQYLKACHASDITIYPKPNNSGKYKIIINTRGKEKTGNDIYENTSYLKEEVVLTTQGPKKVKIKVPSVWDKIAELYKEICKRNNLL